MGGAARRGSFCLIGSFVMARSSWGTPGTWASPCNLARPGGVPSEALPQNIAMDGQPVCSGGLYSRSWTDAHGDQEITDKLKELHFPLQKAPSRESPLLMAATGLEDALEEKTELDSNVTEALMPEDRDAIMAVYDDFAKGLQEIFEVFPTNKVTKVMNLCTPWLDPMSLESQLQEQEWTYHTLSHREGCDLATHHGFCNVREQLKILRPEWLWCHVPLGPKVLFMDHDIWESPRESSKAKRYLKVIRHLLLLSRDHVAQGGKLSWFVQPESQVWTIREVKRFWGFYGKGPPRLHQGKVELASNVEEMCNVTMKNSPEGLWAGVIQAAGNSNALWMIDDDESPLYPVDTSCLETLTTTELERLMQHVRQLHRRFGHPSNRLLIKNLIHRGADERLVAAASKLECDECMESQIKMPAPATNLDKCEKIWSCLQTDGFHVRCGTRVYHFLLMVDEASGFGVIREMFNHPEEEHRNMTGEEVVAVLQEAWFQYFGYPDTLKLDLEGALRKKAECFKMLAWTRGSTWCLPPPSTMRPSLTWKGNRLRTQASRDFSSWRKI